VPNQYHDLDSFLDAVDMVVIMVGRDEIKANMDRLRGKVVFDTRKICELPGTYRL
jgi:UDP-N-acetyl-D-mannosaminuronic acid dehydrogenase